MTSEAQAAGERTKRRVRYFRKLKGEHRRIVFITAHDYPTGLAAEQADVDGVLVGDSLGMVALGFDTTIPVTMEMMVHHTAAVRRALRHPFLVADLPFLACHTSVDDAVRNAGRLVQDGGAEAVKIEGGREALPAIERILAAGIPVLGHLGLLPQSIHRLGGYRVRGRSEDDAELLLEDAKLLQEAGVFAVVLEAVKPQVAARVTEALEIPTIGIGASAQCDGQVLVSYDALGLFDEFVPSFVKRYADLASAITDAAKQYVADVQEGRFPASDGGVKKVGA